MDRKRGLSAGLVGLVALGTVIAAVLLHPLGDSAPAVARGQEHPQYRITTVTPARRPRRTARAAGTTPVPTLHPAARVAASATPQPLARVAPSPTPQPVALPVATVRRRPAARRVRLRAPHAPGSLHQSGGRQPARRTLPIGSWLNAPSLTITARLSSPMTSAHLQLQVELRPAGTRFSGRPTLVSAPVNYHGKTVAARVTAYGLRDGVAYHWQARVRDLRGRSSAWTTKGPVAVRVYLGHPAAPTLRLTTPAQPGHWLASRRLTFHWSAPADGSGIRAYSYTLARRPSGRPLLRGRTRLTGVTVHVSASGRWYFSVRALDGAHTWGAPARLAVRIDTAVPRLRVRSVPAGPINPLRVHLLLHVRLTAWSRVVVQVVSLRGRVLRTMWTGLHGPGATLAVSWDGLDAQGRRVPSGHYLLRLGARGRAGLTWQTTRPLDLLSTPPAFVGFGQTQTGTFNLYNNPIDGPEQITATLAAPAGLRIEAVHQQDHRVVQTWTWNHIAAGQVVTATWTGFAPDGAPLPGGLYIFRAVAVDAAGNRTARGLGWVVLDRRRIVVSLAKEQLWAMDGNHVLLTTLVTTGGPELPTPTGDFQIIDRESPFTFHSLDPPGSPYWYPDSPVNFALLFQSNGYFIHDAPWRSYYGPGSNVIDAPGTNTGGSHGCVNVPYTPMAWLFSWATMYTPVQVRADFTPHAVA